MPTDVILDDRGGTWLTLKANAINASAADFMLNHPERRGNAGGSFRRALVHSEGDRLTINFNGDYSGGVRINNSSINLKKVKVAGETVRLPKVATTGDLILVQNSVPSVMLNGNLLREPYDKFSLWLCIGKSTFSNAAEWQSIPLGETMFGSMGEIDVTQHVSEVEGKVPSFMLQESVDVEE